MPLNRTLEAEIKKQANDTKRVKKIIEFFNKNVHLQNDLIHYLKEINSETLLMHRLAYLGETGLMKRLIDSGANYWFQDEEGNTPLHYAALNKQFAVVELLLVSDNIDYAVLEKLPALSKIQNDNGETPLLIAERHHNGRSSVDHDKNVRLLQDYSRHYEQRRSFLNTSNLPRKLDGLSLSQINTSTESILPKFSPLLKPTSLTPETTFGSTPNWKDASCVPEYQWLTKPTGQIQWKNLTDIKTLDQNVSEVRWGSGCLISDNMFLTAGHCFDSQPGGGTNWKLLDKYTSKPLQPNEFAPFMTVNFSYQYDPCPLPGVTPKAPTQEVKFDIVRVSEHRLNGLDYAIIELAGEPGKKFGKVRLSTTLPKSNEDVVVAQHPKGDLKKVDYGPIVCEGETTCNLNDKIYYKLDTEPGSSGSPVGVAKDKTVVAVHTNGFASLTSQTPANSGVTIAAIKEASRILKDSTLGFFVNSNLARQHSAATNTDVIGRYTPTPSYGTY